MVPTRRTRELVAVSFVTLSAGFVAGWWLGGQEAASGPGGAPHAVGPDEHAGLGTQALQAGDLVTAEQHFRAAAELDPESSRSHSDLAAVLLLGGRWDEARTEIDRARELDPDSPDAWFLTGMLWRDGYGDTLRARQSWERFLELVPPDSPQAATIREWIAGLGAPAGTAADTTP